MENVLGIWKQMLRELLLKMNLIFFFSTSHIVIYCCMLHNLIMKGKDKDTIILMIQLEFENDQSNKGMRNEPQASIEVET